MFESLFSYQRKLFSKYSSITYKRYFFDSIARLKSKTVGIVGARGVGKTTFLVQYLNSINISPSKKLYISADIIPNVSLFEIAEEFAKREGKVLAIDEIHKYPNFEVELKKIYDILDIKVLFSGSSALKIDNLKADLSRRAVIVNVRGLSFREFLEINDGINLPAFSLEDIIKNHTDIAYDLLGKFNLKNRFDEYIQKGYYPFYFEDKDMYLLKLKETVNTAIEVDIPSVFPIEFNTVSKLKKLVYLICESHPYTPNMQELLDRMNMNKADYKNLYRYLHYLDRSKIIRILRSKHRGDNIFSKPDKIYLNNTNLHYAYCEKREIGTVRESLFASILEGYGLRAHSKADFIVNDKYVFEIGGKNKKRKQIRNIENSFLVLDDIEIGTGSKIPIWLFGFLDIAPYFM